MYKYVKEVQIHLIKPEESFVVVGAEAQDLFNFGLDLEDPYIVISLDGVRRHIPRTSILYIDVVENVEANALVSQMKEIYSAICVICDITKDEYGWDYWFVKDGVLYINYEDEPRPLSNDLKAVKFAQTLLALQSKLNRLLSLSVEAEQQDIV